VYYLLGNLGVGLRVALIEKEKKNSTKFFILAQSPKGIRYCPYISWLIVWSNILGSPAIE